MEIVNRVANSSLITLDLEQYLTPGDRVVIDVATLLHEGLIVREKDIRAFAAQLDGASYKNKWVAITCSADVIVPIWAYLLIASAIQPHAEGVIFGTEEALETFLFRRTISSIDWRTYQDAKVIIKGCSQRIPTSAYVDVMTALQPYAKSIMFGEACSAVPLYKKR